MLLVWTSWSIYQQIIRQSDLSTAYQQMLLVLNRPTASIYIVLAIILMPVNWILETYKWYVLLRREMNISFFKCLRAVLAGLSLSMNTPNRIGEYIGRIFYLENNQRLKAAHFSVISGLSQLSITCTAGFLSLFLLRNEFHIAGIDSLLILCVSFLITLLILGLYFFYEQIVDWLTRNVLFKRWLPSFSPLTPLPKSLRFNVLAVSLIRFIIFTTQYLLIFHAFGVKFDYMTGFAIVSIIFLIMAIIPTIAIAELGIRGKVALVVAGQFTSQLLAVTTGTAVIWFLNLIIPSVIGLIFLSRFPLNKRT